MQPGVIYNDIHDNEVVNLTVADGKVTIGEGEAPPISSPQGRTPDRPKGRRKGYLFADSKGGKDKELTRRKAAELMEYLSLYGAEKAAVETRKDNLACRAFCAFYRVWSEEGVTERTLNGGAAYRFLKDDCRLTVECSEDTLGSFLKKTYKNVDSQLIEDVRKASDI